MATGDGVLADGTALWLTNASDTLTKIVGLMAVNRPTLSISKVESTDHDSGKVKEYIPGHGDPGELSATIKYEPGSATDTLLLEHLASREKRPFKIVTVEEDGTTQDNEGTMFLMTYVPDNAPLGGIRTATLTGQPGLITQEATT
ncbi:MAG: hypothetical protein KYX66_18140 [Blastomonas fulva]|uniref:phage tail tube protein n=1 Tax=Blastomonas fulva TaxID=1550728 RepID=UPI0024E1A173|nr:phage tail tube protein [Blastomonas fulva]MDK2758649.1 hypothetical protein [Blastomonas fulva]